MLSEKQRFLRHLERMEPTPGIHDFQQFLTYAARTVFEKSDDRLEKFVDANTNRYWNYLKGKISEDKKRGLKPLITIVDNGSKKFKWYFGQSVSELDPKKFLLLKDRNEILKEIDLLSSREYEALGVLTSQLLGADKYLLTPPGNEAGIDFISCIPFSEASHFLFGINDPIRVIGQCKKYASPAQVNTLKEFNQTLFDIYHLTEKVLKVLPPWFKTYKGIIIGWVIGHNGFQTGAIDRAKNFGIIISDSRDISEIISGSRNFYPYQATSVRTGKVKSNILKLLSEASSPPN